VTRRKVRFTAVARKHLRLLKGWWQENSVRPEILHDDLEEAVEMLSMLPGIGSHYPAAPIRDVRRLYLERLTSHIYYTYNDREVIIRAIWHARRGTSPDFG
jgi:plasmid stabilization system protein ParE